MAQCYSTDIIATPQAHLIHCTMLFLYEMQTGDTPLHAAAIQGHLEVIKILLKQNADVEARNNVRDEYHCNCSIS